MGLRSPNKAALVGPDDDGKPAQPAEPSPSSPTTSPAPAGGGGEGDEDEAAAKPAHLPAGLSNHRRRVAWYALAVAVIVCLGAVAGTLGVFVPRWMGRTDRQLLGEGGPAGAAGNNITLCCQATRYPDLCRTSLTGDPRSSGGGPSPFLVRVAVDQAGAGVSGTLDSVEWYRTRPASGNVSTVVDNCVEVLDMAVERLSAVNESWGNADPVVMLHWLSAVLTWQTDCWNALSKPDITSDMQNSTLVGQAKDTITMLSNAVSMTRALANYGPDPGQWRPPGTDGLLQGGPGDGGDQYRSSSKAAGSYADVNYKPDPRIMPVGNGWRRRKLLDGGAAAYPEWLSKQDRRLLQDASLGAVVPSVTVSKDGLAQFTTVQAAVDAAPARSATRWVVYIREGVYNEIVVVPRDKTNLMFLGDGMGRSVITGSRNVQMANVTTFNSATVAVNADGFLAYGMTFENTAGPDNHQAVALRLDSDLAAFQSCSFLGYQDTLYTHTLRQFFTQCTIQGTIDFIFGNSASVFQNCLVQCVLGNPTVGICVATAQGRTDPAQSTGYVFQNCTVNGTASYVQEFLASPSRNKGYLGRPWKPFSLTIFISTLIESIIQPEGWLPWDSVSPLNTLFYGEYGSYGPGATNLAARVPWSNQLTLAQVQPYTVSNFIQGNQWLPSIAVPFADM